MSCPPNCDNLHFEITPLSNPQQRTKHVESNLGMVVKLDDVNLDELYPQLKIAFRENVNVKVSMYKRILKLKLKEFLNVLKDVSNFDENKDLLAIVDTPNFSDKAGMFKMQETLSEAQGVTRLIRQFVNSENVTWINIAKSFYETPYIHFTNEELDIMNSLNACGIHTNQANATQFLSTVEYEKLLNLAVKLGMNVTSEDEEGVRRAIHEGVQEIRVLSNSYCPKKKFKNPARSSKSTLLTPTDVRVLRGVALMPEFKYLLGSVKSEETLEFMYNERFNDLKAVVGELLSSSNACGDLFSNVDDVNNNSSRYTIESTCAKLITGFASNPFTFEKQHLNMVLMGDPGMGKTRYAGLIGRVLKGAGILLSEKPVDIISRGELVGQYLGQTAPRTNSRLMSNLESVLVIDEAYRLAVRDIQNNKWDEYGQEAIGEIVNFLDKHKGQISVIGAGYEKEMRNDFLKINAGMPRRFPIQIMLPSYTETQLVNIFCLFMSRSGLLNRLTKDALGLLKTILSTPGVRDSVFPNGAGDIENFSAVVQTVMSSSTKSHIDPCSLYSMFKLFCMQTQNKECKMTIPGANFCNEEPGVSRPSSPRKRIRRENTGYIGTETGVCDSRECVLRGIRGSGERLRAGGTFRWNSSDVARFERLMMLYDVNCETVENYNDVEFMMNNIELLLKTASTREEREFLGELNGKFYKKWAWSRIKYYLKLADVEKVTRYLSPRRAISAILGVEDVKTTNELNSMDFDPEYKRIIQYVNALYFVYENSDFVANTTRSRAGYSTDHWVVKRGKQYFGYDTYPKLVKRT
jgi:hypothetical protein